jgi:hypothetical protein
MFQLALQLALIGDALGDFRQNGHLHPLEKGTRIKSGRYNESEMIISPQRGAKEYRAMQWSSQLLIPFGARFHGAGLSLVIREITW